VLQGLAAGDALAWLGIHHAAQQVTQGHEQQRAVVEQRG
jgi:hypothetical protein